jgi:putative sterol carrier protein
MYELFGSEWTQAFGEKIRASEAYKEAAKTWEWPLFLMLQADPSLGIPEDRLVYLDLWHGECRQARVGTRDDLERTPYIISADAYTWKQVLTRKLEPIYGIMRGKLKLVKGSMGTLAGYVLAAKELVMATTQFETRFPEGLE